ncbi:hypothetical protein BgAZ_200640 [Babesia gibsoni]|uniref:Uncharacterized protein n=1 Tax=Babesia gibsoni TaxID=33632 RepID=A0AAD8LKJ5_BABGI|nr:hypothetical protein BgAZ_200640 [Babesia gibsoni]
MTYILKPYGAEGMKMTHTPDIRADSGITSLDTEDPGRVVETSLLQPSSGDKDGVVGYLQDEENETADSNNASLKDYPYARPSSVEYMNELLFSNSSLDDPYFELRLASQRNTFTYGEIQEFNIGTPPSGRSAVSCPNCNFYHEYSESSQNLESASLMKRGNSFGKKFSKAKKFVKSLARKPVLAAMKLTKYCKKCIN